MSTARGLVAVACWTAVIAGISALTRVPYHAEPEGRSLLRLSWRAIGERIERCRQATAAELEGVPAHMRQPLICEGARVAPYELRVSVDGHVVHDALAPGTGVAGDRPIYVLQEFELVPGPHRIEVRFRRRPEAEPAAVPRTEEAGAASEHEREVRRRTIPSPLVLDTAMVIRPGGVVLVTYSAESHTLVLTAH